MEKCVACLKIKKKERRQAKAIQAPEMMMLR
jgi:hypothetical protein